MKTETGTDIIKAAQLLHQGALVGMPTETVYGLAAHAENINAIQKVFAVKGRPAQHPLIVHVATRDAIRDWVSFIPPAAEKLLAQFAPGPLTVVLQSNGRLPEQVGGGRRELAFRVPAHPLAEALLRTAGIPVVAPSANPFMRVSPTSAAHVHQYFDGVLPYILDGGPCSVGIESTVVGFDETGATVIYREGAITKSALEAIAGPARHTTKQAHGPSPGLHPRHYSPKTPLRLEAGTPDIAACDRCTGFLRFSEPVPGWPIGQQYILSDDGDLEVAARRLYEGLHQLDRLGLHQIIAESAPDFGLGSAINDRLRRAAATFTAELSTITA